MRNASQSPSAEFRLELNGISKSYGPTRALIDVHLALRPGRALALIGENGAGKSTLMKVISGAHSPDTGEMKLDGQVYRPRHPVEARRAGVAMIYQELNLAPHLNAIENITLGSEPHSKGWIHARQRRQLAENALEKLQYSDLPLDKPVSLLTIGQKQIIEIARALIHRPRVLILDEPTSSLTQVDAKKLFNALSQLRQDGVSILYISHFLEECRDICDDFAVLRDGRSVLSGGMAETDLTRILTAMVGRRMEEIYPRPPDSIGPVLLKLDQVKGISKPRSVSLELRAGEILGIAGLIGAGRTESLRCLFGLDHLESGSIAINDVGYSRPSPAQSLRRGLGLVSENRKEEGLLLNRSVADNLTLTRHAPVSKWGLISGKKHRQVTRDWIQRLQVKVENPDQLMCQLSGGNQQKIAIGRILFHGSQILLLDEPTRGIDVGSKAQIYQLIGGLAREGRAILFVSSYLPELLGVCHTIAVMNRGILTESRPTEQWDEHQLIAAAIQTTPPETFSSPSPGQSV